jgi:hypothetical protein
MRYRHAVPRVCHQVIILIMDKVKVHNYCVLIVLVKCLRVMSVLVVVVIHVVLHVLNMFDDDLFCLFRFVYLF